MPTASFGTSSSPSVSVSQAQGPEVPLLPVDAPSRHPSQVWSQHQTPEGKLYYYNSVTRQSVWEKPVDFMPNTVTLQRMPSSG